jgi:hypothetical protein
MKGKITSSITHGQGGTEVPARGDGLLDGVRTLSGQEMINRVLQLEDPRAAVQELSSEDFYWMVKKVGDQDDVALLELASETQWQYVLDLEIWDGDRLDLLRTDHWISRLGQADCVRLVQWFFSQAEFLAHYYLYCSVEVIVVQDDEEAWNIPDGYFSTDGVFYIRAADPESRPHLENLLRVMAEEDHERYQALLLSLAGVLSAEVEEEMYRWRNIRIAEHGFLPKEEALAIYAPLDLNALHGDAPPVLPNRVEEAGETALVPLAPLEHAERGNLLTDAVSAGIDPLLLDRLRLEFAGLCNQILSADGDLSPELEDLEGVCRKAASYVNLALERLAGKEREAVEQTLREHSLVALFRTGYGLALKIKWEAERWMEKSWFAAQGLATDFWGEYWGGILHGVLQKRPRLFVGDRGGEGYREFEWLSDLADCLRVIRRIMVLDGLLDRLAGTVAHGLHVLESPDITLRPLFFNSWARRLVKARPSFAPITPSQARRFFEKLRGKGSKGAPPYPMTGFEKRFVRDFMAFAADSEPEAAAVLEDTLGLIWQEFNEEYQAVSLEDLDGRYSKFITIREPRTSAH